MAPAPQVKELPVGKAQPTAEAAVVVEVRLPQEGTEPPLTMVREDRAELVASATSRVRTSRMPAVAVVVTVVTEEFRVRVDLAAAAWGPKETAAVPSLGKTRVPAQTDSVAAAVGEAGT